MPLTQRNLVANCLQGRARVPGLGEGREIILIALPMFHAYGITGGLLVEGYGLTKPRRWRSATR